MIAGLRNWMETEKPAIMDQPQFLSNVAAGDRPKLPKEDNTVSNRALIDRIMDLRREEPELFAVLVEKYQEQANQANITINPDVAEAARRRANRPGSSGDARPRPGSGAPSLSHVLRGRNPTERERVRKQIRALRDQTTSERHAMDYLRHIQDRRAKEDRIGYVIGPPTHAR